MKLLKPREPITQKAKGLAVLRDRGFHVTKFCIFREPREVIEQADGVNLTDYPPYMNYPVFARPCPVRPRHGFVDSRVVHDWEALRAVWLETLDADPDGELMVSRPINAECNAVVTPTSLTIGAGNDGATAGRNVTTLPLVTSQRWKPRMLEDAHIGADEDPYLEAVLPQGWQQSYSTSGDVHSRWLLTQLRAGVRAEYGTGNYIPRAIAKVSNVIDPESFTLIEWEQYVSTMEADEVVYHPAGSLTSHYAIHAIMHKIPFITHGVAPEVGEPLTQEVTEEIVYDPQEFLRGIMIGDALGQQLGTKDMDTQTTLALVGLYNASALHGANSVWIGVSLALLMKLGSLALRGEARHIGGKAVRSRGTVYRYYAQKPLHYHARFSRRWAHIFANGIFGSTAVGGKKWAACAEGIERLVATVQTLAKDPTDAHVRDAICVMNYVVDLAHNNGWWLNKFCSSTVYERVQRGYLSTVLECAQLIPRVLSLRATYTARSIAYAEQLAVLQKWTPRPLKIKTIYESAVFHKMATSGSGQKAIIEVHCKDTLLRKHRKPLQVYFPLKQWRDVIERVATQGISVQGTKIQFKNTETGEEVTLDKVND